MSSVAHISGWKPCILHDVERASRVGSVLQRDSALLIVAAGKDLHYLDYPSVDDLSAYVRSFSRVNSDTSIRQHQFSGGTKYLKLELGRVRFVSGGSSC